MQALEADRRTAPRPVQARSHRTRAKILEATTQVLFEVGYAGAKTPLIAERAEIERGMEQVASRIEADMDPYVAARQLDTDEIVALAELRSYLSALVEMSYQATGARRIKNPRIWSLHDLDALAGGSA